ncbi:MAG TPA: protein kinase [Steroidobacteraceae bacterium]
MFMTDNLADQEADARSSAITIDLYPALTRVITQKIRAISADAFEDMAQPNYSWKAGNELVDVFPTSIGIGSVLRERYVIQSCLGSGGMGTVYKAVDIFRRAQPGVDSHVAIKVLHESTHKRPDVLDRLRREFYCAQSLSHRSIIKVFDLDRDGAVDFFTMEHLEGELLSAVVRKFQPRQLPRASAWALIRDIGEGLVHAHDRNVVHADLKPQNIMVTATGEVRILDFGASSGTLGATLGFSHNRSSLAVTPAYASCELLAGRTAEPSDDLFALACLSYELLAGQHPFRYKRADEARDAKMVPQKPLGLTTRQWATLQRGLSFERKDRNIAVRDWLKELRPASAALRAIPQPEPVRAAARIQIDDLFKITWLSPRMLTVAAILFVSAAVGLALRLGGTELSASQAQMPLRLDYAAEAPQTAEAAAQQGSVPLTAKSFAAAAPTPPPDTDPIVAKPPRHHAPLAARPAISVAAQTLKVAPGQRFAEVRIRRNEVSDRPLHFSWWTEDGSALAGADYLAQPRTTGSFAPGSHTASVFIKVLPNDARRQATAFKVMIANPSDGSKVDEAKATVMLEPTRL